MKLRRLLIIVTAFAIAMGFLEAAVVVYLREILYPKGFAFPLQPITANLALTELLRELATMIMLVSIGFLAAGAMSTRDGALSTRGRFSTGFAWFIYSFAIWDILYYVFLYLILGWPESLLTWDVLFLIPTTWTGPVLTPVLASLSMILLALIILRRSDSGAESRLPKRIWAGLISGSLVLITGWIWDYSSHMLENFTVGEMLQVRNPQVLNWATTYVPESFPWGIYATGLSIILIAIAYYGFYNKKILS